MTVYIDAPTWPGHGRFWSHLVSDVSYDELHAFAIRIGAPRRGFDRDHYDVPSDLYARWRKQMIDAEREKVVEVRDSGKVAHEVVDDVLSMLDIEESMLDYSSEERQRVRSSGVALALEGDCEHLQEPRPPVDPDTPGECGDCLRAGTSWVHLRMCVVCGHIACCDSSPERHASAHHQHSGHEVMRSAEPGEDWRWCFVDQLTG